MTWIQKVARLARAVPAKLLNLVHTHKAQILPFVTIGAIATMLYIVIFVLLVPHTGATLANLIGFALTAVGNIAANRKFTFNIEGTDGVVRHHLQGIIVFVVTVTAATVMLAVLHRVEPNPSHWLELMLLLGVNSSATVARFMLMRYWVFKASTSNQKT